MLYFMSLFSLKGVGYSKGYLFEFTMDSGDVRISITRSNHVGLSLKSSEQRIFQRVYPDEASQYECAAVTMPYDEDCLR